ncbi:demethylmenaquinone methyltransferase [Kytococcus sedentarius]|uniref:Demethylmenaquinone methyltransferase n=1 Tax=Kytococcus sedentarius (strain ATCC 14392 / DSM 20547 / JCM 11482 / CCUG 33030 / NBRC 15357 / NCTC 11040 / CCM 314 / 541) TaxID=478801 RepID=C7NLD4_KYTSD|nr:demethylmenaquinone methyltransferase [Kytococcus sedentarius]ACV07130.1 2-octaprenyl-6-methoxy-1,4-benzoquinone methylase /demethylmenaquinone methyltransferase [Kytococcus sedentarius DSM 20547]QQB63113.1 demethylmenaquinone methyltransferase [Kytococcus sedentarius]STX14040.1 Ubiquinone/menaquinone biosynthesis methyltransferase ubiE [Kytococcus sedentarius]
MTRASLAKDPSHVSSMFDEVAPRYDCTNDVLSMGQARLWRRAVTRTIAPRPGMRILDLGAGTGTSSEPLADAGADVVPADFSEGMLAEGRRRRPDMPFTHADAMDLPFEDASFDVTTISFALRNVADPALALREMARVTRPGGRLVLCEFSSPTFAPFRTVYDTYLMKALPAIASRVSSNPESYHYLAESIADWPDRDGVRRMVEAAGWTGVEVRNLSGGVVALHTAHCPAGR